MSVIQTEDDSAAHALAPGETRMGRWARVVGKLHDLCRAGLDRVRRIGPHGIRWATGVGIGLLVLLLSALPLINKYWPYRYRNVKPMLENVMVGDVTITKYHRTYFPSPGFVAEGVTVRRKSALDLPPIGTIAHLRVVGSWMDLATLRQRVQLVDLEGVKVEIPAAGSPASQREFPAGSSADFTGPTTAVLEMRVRDAELDILHADASRTVFPIERLVLRGLENGKAVRYAVDMENPMPVGHIHATGSFGPTVPSDLGSTPLADDFSFTGVRLSDVGKLRGTLNAQGRFRGTLASIAAEASSDTPEFAVNKGRAADVKGDVRCTINALNGDVVLNQIAVTIGRTTINVAGSVAGSPKVTDVQITSSRGRVEDLLGIFLENRPPVVGAVSLQSHARLTSGTGDFFSRLEMNGSFDAPAQKFTNKDEEKTLTEFSQRAQGAKQAKDEKVRDVLSSLKGSASIRDGVLHTDDLEFAVPGASAKLHGTFSLRSRKADLKGDMRMDTDVTHVTTGVKAMLLKPVAPLFARKHAGAVVPVEVTGGANGYKVGPNLIP